MKMDSGKAKMMGMLLASKKGQKNGKTRKAEGVATGEVPKKKKKDSKRTMLASALM